MNSGYRRLRKLLLQASETESDRALRALFAAPQLQPWQRDLPETDSREARVDALLAYLQEKRSHDSERALVRLLQELAARTDPQAAAHEELVALAQALAAHPATPEDTPYRGLYPFREEDSATFFGREAMVERLLTLVQQQPPLVPLLGASGSGKSSVVFAGLLPRLRAAGRSRPWRLPSSIGSTPSCQW